MQIYDNILIGINRAFDRHNRTVGRINRRQVAEGFVDMMQADKSVRANIKVSRAQNQMTRSLLDIYG